MEITLGGAFLFFIGCIFAGGPIAFMGIILPATLFGPPWLKNILGKPKVTLFVWILATILVTAFLANTFKSGSGYNPHECKDTLQGLICN